MDLDSLALHYNADKGSIGHDYCATFYDDLLEPIRNDPVVLLELGVDQGASMRLWSTYFRNGLILGVDNFKGEWSVYRKDPRADLEQLRNVVLFECDQEDERLVDMVAPYCPFDIVIDDCSHLTELTIASFTMLWPMLKPGGLYIIEDIGMQPDPDEKLAAALAAATPETIVYHQTHHPQVRHFRACVVRKHADAD